MKWISHFLKQKPKIVVILGPTATGKTSLSIAIAKKHNGEVISADSRQVYRGLDIGTAKVTTQEMENIPHCMIDVADPKNRYDVQSYKKEAGKCIQKIFQKKKLPIVCGGSGMYIDALVSEHSFPKVPPNPALRKELESIDTDELVKRLARLDQQRAKNIDTKNRVRLIRAIEIAQELGAVPSLISKSPYRVLYIGLDIPKEQHAKIIRKRIISRDKNNALVDEVHGLIDNGLSTERLEELGLEYRYITQYLKGKFSYQEMVYKLGTKTIQFAKRQRTWFKRNKKIRWFNPLTQQDEIFKTVQEFL